MAQTVSHEDGSADHPPTRLTGEIEPVDLLEAMDADGTQDGFDLDLIRHVRAAVTIPVIASGGAGTLDHFPPAVDAGADAVLAATVFHFGTLRISEVKQARAGRRSPHAEIY